MKCDRGSSHICLDWREICDGKIDCLDGGEDEKYCLELFMNQCADNEYQCRDRMCINEKFLTDTSKHMKPSHECLDRSDESYSLNTIGECEKDISFRCEHTVCPLSDYFSCGNGYCIQWPVKMFREYCLNHRDRIFSVLFS
ncbi:unnamed protein product [Rotaria magnacalcarata]|uniref:Uncharacterized protein n=1 Tax=Rotaria magnacalcarata TaxID=392030 RepID=A0A815SMY4_9BILA|nr:unnamed protein product [Rotaria magnacalcarata]CAF4146398.1 unnamed protein product [Rotaria magnacalcarata]